MTTMNISLPESLKAFVEQQVAEHGYSTTSEYVRELIRKDQESRDEAIERLRALLLEGANSPLGPVADDAFFEEWRERIRQRSGE